MQVTDGLSELLAELELTLGEGPSRDAAAAGGRCWPRIWVSWKPSAAGRCRAGGLSGRGGGGLRVPAAGGGDPAGMMGFYRERPGPLSAFQLGDALVFADTATLLLLESQGRPAAGSGPGGQPPDLALHRAEIDQATGMLTEQLGVGIARHSSACAPTLTSMICGWPTLPAKSLAAACGSSLTPTRLRTVTCEASPGRQRAGRTPRALPQRIRFAPSGER